MSKKQRPELRSTCAVERDPLWAIAAALPTDALQWCKRELLEALPEADLEIVSGQDGFTAMLAFAGSSDMGGAYARELSAKYEAVTYLLDFDDEAEHTGQYHVRVQRQSADPLAFLKTRGMVPPSRRAEPPPRDPADAAIREALRDFANELDPRCNLKSRDPLNVTEALQWAIVAAAPTEALQWCRSRLPWELREEGSLIISGTQGSSALLGYGGSNDLWMSVAVRFSELFKTSSYLLELGGDERSIKKLDVRVRSKKVPPAELLAAHGIEVFEPLPARVITRSFIGVVDDITPEQARKALPKARARFSVNARGVLVNESGYETLDLSRKLKRQSFELLYDRADGYFMCVVRRPGQEDECFDPIRRAVNYVPIDSILGETTLEGILRVLDIPRHLLPLSPEGAATENPRSPAKRR